MKRKHLFLTAAILILITGICSADVWKYEKVINSRSFSRLGRNAIAVDNSGRAHICYYGTSGSSGGLFHCRQDAAGWKFERLEQLLGTNSAIVIEDGDNLIMQHNRFAQGNNGVYSVEEIDPYPSDYLRNPDIAVDSSGAIHAVCFGEDYPYVPLYYVTNAGGSWQVEQVCNANDYVEKSTAIAIDSMGRPHISVQVPDGETLHVEHHYYDGSNWQVEQVKDTHDTDGTDIFIDGADNVYIVFTNKTGGWSLNYADNSTGSWREQEIVSDSNDDFRYFNPRLTIDPCGVVHTFYTRAQAPSGYYYYIPSEVYHCYGQWGNWSSELVADCHSIGDVSLATDANGIMHLAIMERGISSNSYYDNYILKHARGQTGSWQVSKVDDNMRVDYSSWIELDSGDNPKILVGENIRNELIFADRTGDDDWSLEQVPTSRMLYDIGWYSGANYRMDLDSDDNVHITYQGWSDDDPYGDGVGYVSNAAGNWVDDYNTIMWCHMPEIAANSAGDVKLTTYSNHYDYVSTLFYNEPVSNWDYGILDIASDVNGFCHEDYVWADMECDDWGGYHIAYVFGGDNGSDNHLRYDMKYGYSSGAGSFAVETIAEDVGAPSSFYMETNDARPMLAVDGYGKVHIAWVDTETDVVKYATDATGSWQVEDVNVPGQMFDKWLDIAADSHGQPYIVLKPHDDEKVLMASKIMGIWQIQDVTENLEIGGYPDTIKRPAIQIDSQDKVHLSFRFYIDYESGIYYATNAVVTPVVSVDPNLIHFTAIEGGSVDEPLEIRNTGTGDLHVSSIEIVGPDADKFSVSTSGMALPPGGLAVRNVSFSSAVKGSYEAVLKVNSDDNQRPEVNVSLMASCLMVPTGELFTKYNYYDLGEVVVGQLGDEVTVRIQNTGNVSMSVGYGISDANDFKCTRFVSPVTLGAGESLYIDVWFTPGSVGYKNCVLYVSGGSGMYTSSLEVAFTGVGVPVPVPGISIQADSNELEAILPGGQETVDIYIKNIGDADLTISDLQVSNTTQFTTDPNAGKNPLGTTLPVTLLPGESRSIVMAFNASILGEYTNELDITSNDPEQKHAITTFLGKAVPWNKCDFNLDKIIDFEDFATLAKDWLAKPDINPYPGDVVPEEPDGLVNMLDLEYFVNQWLLTKEIF